MKGNQDPKPQGPPTSPAVVTRRTFLFGAASLTALAVTGCDEDPGGADIAPADVGIDSGLDTRWVYSLDTLQPDTANADTQDASDGPPLGDTADASDDSRDVSGPPFNPGMWNESASKFPYGVQAGAMRLTSDATASVVLWSIFDVAEARHVRVWEREDGRDGPLVAEALVDASAEGVCKTVMDGLTPGSSYCYGFFDDSTGKRSLIGRFRAPLAPGAREPLTIGATSCTSWENAPYPALVQAAAEELDFFVHLGDMVYTDVAPTATTLEAYRARWRDTLLTDGYAALLPTVGTYVVWDDHELANNLNPETVDPARLEAAKAAFFENLANEEGPNHQLWTSFRWGDTAEIFLLDCRSERLPSSRTSADATYLSSAQMDWLQAALVASPCHFKIVLNSVPITNMPLAYDVLASDRWEGYAAQRDALLNSIETNALRNVWFLSGDFHLGFVSRVGTSGYAAGIHEIAVGPGGNGPNPLAFWPHPAEQFPFVSPSGQATTTLTFDPLRDCVQVRFVDGASGEVLLDQEFTAG